MSKPSVLIRKSTGEILKRGLYPRPDMAPVEGLDPDLEWAVEEETPRPSYDPIYYHLTRSGALGGPHTEYPWLSTWVWSYTPEKRLKEEIISRIEDIDRAEMVRELTPIERDKMLLLGLGVILRNLPAAVTNGFSAKEKVITDKLLSAAIRVFQNDDHLKALISQVNADAEPDANAGWPNRP